MGQMGLERTVSGSGDLSSHAGKTDIVLRNSNNGRFEIGEPAAKNWYGQFDWRG